MKSRQIDLLVTRMILVAVLIFHCICGWTQPFRFEHLTSSDGISQSEVYAFLEDSRGFMWIGTLDGLNRFDGYDIEIFNTERNDPNSLSNNTIRSLKEDALGRIWIGTNEGLNCYDPAYELIYQVKMNTSVPSLSVWSLSIHNNYLLVGTNDGLYTTEISGVDLASIESAFHKIEFFSKNKSAHPLVRSIIPSKYGGLWIQSHNNISRVAFQEFSDELVIIEDLPLGNFGNQTTAIEDSSGNLWIASTIDGLARYNPGTMETTLFTNGENGYSPISDKCSALNIDREGNLWVGTLDRGISFASAESLSKDIISFTSFQNVPGNPNSLNSNLIYSLYVAQNNSLWVGTIGSGVNIFNPAQKRFHHYKFYNSSLNDPKSNFVRAVYVDAQDNLWIGTHNDGLYLLNRKTGNLRKLGFESLTIFHIAKYSENKKFICTGQGIYLVELIGNNMKILSNNNLEQIPPAVFNIIQSREGIFWYASLSGIARIKVVNDKILNEESYSTDTDPAISTGNCRVLFYYKKDYEMMIGTEGGGLNIMSLDENHFPVKNRIYYKSENPQSISSNSIRSILADSRDNIWIGTYEGLNLMTRDSLSGDVIFKTYSKDDGLPNNMIQLLMEDNQQAIWIGTNGGLTKFIPDKDEFINYTVNDGIQSKEFSEHTVFKKPDGEIIVGGINGINFFYPDQIEVSDIIPQTTLTGLYISNQLVKPLQKVGKTVPLGKSIVLTDTLILSPRQKNIGFEFSSMIYPNAENVKYRYKLEGFEDDWRDADESNRIANYTNLKHGKYRFIVKSASPDGIWSPPKELYVHIQTPFESTIVAYIIYILIILLIFSYFSLRYTTRRNLLLTREHADKLHKLDEMRMRFFINISHDLRTPLTLITGPLDKLLKNRNFKGDEKEDLQLIKRNVKRLSYLVEQLLDVRKSESGVLSPKLQMLDLVSFAKEETAHFTYAIKKKGIKLTIRSTLDRIMTQFDPQMISKVFFNVISNALKFTDEGEIGICIDRINKEKHELLKNAPASKYIRVEIRDTGRGISNEKKQKIFERFYQDHSQTEFGYGIGLSHTKELIDAQQGFIEVESKEGMGTTIRFYLPEVESPEDREKKVISSTEDLYVNTGKFPIESSGYENKSMKSILLVEDNDDMRNFITKEIKSEYEVLEASDGIEGLKIAEDRVPDLIVSDVMMPNMDGIELCEKIKSNIKTSHIPVILLTAKVDLETKYKGIETGADDFIPKPFEIEYLSLRIKNLLHSREELRKLFKNSSYLEPSAVTVTSIDERFLTTLKLAIEKNMSKTDFSITSLESEMGMSHANFYRKIKGLTGQSGQELVQIMRMKRAHQVLSENKGLRVAEVAYLVGFTNPKYFSKCFKEAFGYPPSDLKQQDLTDTIT